MSKNSKNRREKLYELYKNIPLKDFCEECNISGSIRDSNGFLLRKVRLTRHHIDYNAENNSPSNIKTLCRKCHDKEHMKTVKPTSLAPR